METGPHPDGGADTIRIAAARLAELLTGTGGGLRDPGGSDLVFETELSIRGLDPARFSPPADVWAVDGGQGLVADAKCLQVYVTRASRVRWDPHANRTVVEDEGRLVAHLLGLGEDRRALAALGSPVDPDAAVDVNLLRDWGEWAAAARCLDEALPGGLLLMDGDLQPDWRIPSWWLADFLSSASAADVVPVGITKHTSLSWGGSPLLGVLEGRAATSVGGRACWWAPVARTRPDVGVGIQVVVARLDPDARFSFRVDMPTPTPSRCCRGSGPSATTQRSRGTRIPSASPTGWPPAPAGCATRSGCASTRSSTPPGCHPTSGTGPSPTATA